MTSRRKRPRRPSRSRIVRNSSRRSSTKRRSTKRRSFRYRSTVNPWTCKPFNPEKRYYNCTATGRPDIVLQHKPDVQMPVAPERFPVKIFINEFKRTVTFRELDKTAAVKKSGVQKIEKDTFDKIKRKQMLTDSELQKYGIQADSHIEVNNEHYHVKVSGGVPTFPDKKVQANMFVFDNTLAVPNNCILMGDVSSIFQLDGEQLVPNQVVALFGASGSGKTYNTGKLLRFIASNNDRRITSIKLTFVYGQSCVDSNDTLITRHRKSVTIETKATQRGTTSKGNQTLIQGDVTKNLQYYLDNKKFGTFVDAVQQMLNNMGDAGELNAFFQKTGIRWAKQTWNNLFLSSRCTTIYEVKYTNAQKSPFHHSVESVEAGTVYLVDAAGNESAYDILCGFYDLPNNVNETQKDETVKRFISTMMAFEKSQFRGDLKSQMMLAGFTIRLDSELERVSIAGAHSQTGVEGTKNLMKGLKTTVMDLLRDPVAYHKYAFECVMESFDINANIGKMENTLQDDADDKNFKQCSTLALIDSENHVQIVSHDEGKKYRDLVRFAYDKPSETDVQQELKTDDLNYETIMNPRNQNEFHKVHKLLKRYEKTYKTETSKFFPIGHIMKELGDGTVNGLMIVPTRVPGDNQQKATINGTRTLIRTLVGERQG